MGNATLASKVRDERVQWLMRNYGDSVLRMCYAYLKDKNMAEDATQDTFIKAYQNMDKFTAHDSWSEKAWLLRIAINTCKDYKRTAWFRHIDRNVTPDDLFHMQGGLDYDAKNIVEDVCNLPPKYKEVILLHYYQDMAVGEISNILGIAPSTVYKRLKYAQQKLRVTLERGGSK